MSQKFEVFASSTLYELYWRQDDKILVRTNGTFYENLTGSNMLCTLSLGSLWKNWIRTESFCAVLPTITNYENLARLFVNGMFNVFLRTLSGHDCLVKNVHSLSKEM